MTDESSGQGPWAPGSVPQPAAPPLSYPPPRYHPSSAPPPYPPAVGPFSPLVGRPLVSNETTWSLLAHLSIFVLGIVGPIIIMVTEGKKSAYTRYHAVEALNMHLTVLIGELACTVAIFLGFALFSIAPFLFLGPLCVYVAVFIGAYVYGVLAAMAANRGETYRYPLTIRMVK